MVTVEGLEKVCCVQCGSTKSLVYHHISYDPEEVEVRCQSCNILAADKKNPRPKNFHSRIVKANTITLKISDRAESFLRGKNAFKGDMGRFVSELLEKEEDKEKSS